MCIENGSEVSYERGREWPWRCYTRLDFVLQRYTIHFENKRCCSLFLIANNSLGFPLVFKLSVSSNLLSNDTLHYKWWHLTHVAFPYLHQQKKFTRHNSIRPWHLVIAIKHEGHPFCFCTNYQNITLFTLKKSSLIWFDLHIPHLISPISQLSHHIAHTFTRLRHLQVIRSNT